MSRRSASGRRSRAASARRRARYGARASSWHSTPIEPSVTRWISRYDGGRLRLLAELERRAARVGDPGRFGPQPGPGELELVDRDRLEHRPQVAEDGLRVDLDRRLDESLFAQPRQHVFGLARRAPAGSAGRSAPDGRRAAGRPRRSRARRAGRRRASGSCPGADRRAAARPARARRSAASPSGTRRGCALRACRTR